MSQHVRRTYVRIVRDVRHAHLDYYIEQVKIQELVRRGVISQVDIGGWYYYDPHGLFIQHRATPSRWDTIIPGELDDVYANMNEDDGVDVYKVLPDNT